MGSDPFRSEGSIEFTGENIGEFLLNVLTTGLYNQPNLILREYIQNGHDAICAWPKLPQPGRIDIQVVWPNIHIFDNGPGMDKLELIQAMSNIGKSLKNMSAGSGFMGIGKLAGISMASRVEIHSSKYGIPEKNWVTFESAEMLAGIMERRGQGANHSILETLTEHTKVNEVSLPENEFDHYTSIHLLGIADDYKDKILDEAAFIKSIGLVAPVALDPTFEHSSKIEDDLRKMIPDHYRPINIFINGKSVYRPYIDGLNAPKEIIVLDDDENLAAYGWACLHTASQKGRRQIADEDLRGIVLTQRGIAIGSRTLAEEMGLYSSTSDDIYFRWYCGELYILDPRILVSTDRTRIRQDKYTSDFVKKTSKEFRKLARIASSWANQDNAETIVQESAVKVNQIEEQIRSQPLTSDRIPAILSALGKTQADVEKKKRYLVRSETKTQAEEVTIKVGSILDTITVAQKNQSSVQQEGMLTLSTFIEENKLAADVLTEDANQFLPTSDVLVGSPIVSVNPVILHDIPDKFDFTPRETLIYNTVIQAVAEACGGKSSDKFASTLSIIEKALEGVFSSSDAEVI